MDPVKTPLLSTKGEKPNQHERIRGRDSVTALKRDFFSQLPEKIRSQLDPETPFELDLSKTNGLVEGMSESPYSLFFVFVSLNIFLLDNYNCLVPLGMWYYSTVMNKLHTLLNWLDKFLIVLYECCVSWC